MNNSIHKSLIAFTLLSLAMLPSSSHAQKWSLVYSNSNDGWTGPVAVEETFSNLVLRTIPITYQPLNTNFIQFANLTELTITNFITNFITIDTNKIAKAVADGVVCAVRGHIWESGCGVIGCLVLHGDVQMRHCVLCNKTETRELLPWK